MVRRADHLPRMLLAKSGPLLLVGQGARQEARHEALDQDDRLALKAELIGDSLPLVEALRLVPLPPRGADLGVRFGREVPALLDGGFG